MNRHAEIAGGGFGGLAAAIALRGLDWSVTVHEQAPTARSAGWGIAIHENGIRVLDALGVLAPVLTSAMRISALITTDGTGRPTSEQPVKARTYRISRNVLLQSLTARAEALGVEIRYGSPAVSATPEGTLVLASGESRVADLIIAADGIGSRIRDSLPVRTERRRLKDGAMRLVVPRLPDERAAHPEQAAPTVEHWSGARRLIYSPCTRDDAYLALSCLASDAEGSAIPVDVAAWRRSFPHLDELFTHFDAVDTGASFWQPFETVSLDRWSVGKVAFVGDSAHAMPPNLGQGAGCALMNALALATHLERGTSQEAALQQWEAAERPLTDHTQRWSRLYSGTTTWPPIARSAAFALTARSKWLRGQLQRTAQHVPTGTEGLHG